MTINNLKIKVSSTESKSVWIMGAYGFIGRHLTRTLTLSGHLISGIGHGRWFHPNAEAWGMKHWIEGDISFTNLQFLKKSVGIPEVIYHLAGGSSVHQAISKPRDDFSRTVDSTLEILEWIRIQSPSTRLIAVSSAAVYGSGHQGRILESQAGVPFSPYGYHKLIMEQLCQSYASTYGVNVIIPRLFSVYGEYLKKQLLWDLCSKLNSNTSTIELGGTGEELRDWTDIRDITRALVLVKDYASDSAPIINLGTGKATSVRDVVRIALEVWPQKAKFSFSGLSRKGDPFSLVANGSRLDNIGFEWRIPLVTGVRDYVSWYLLNLGENE
jgi:UDP-glucose 4-epimerase